MNFDLNSKLPPEFYQKHVTEVAKNLLGKIFIKQDYNIFLAGKIVETEAYDGINDEASHTYRGKTERNKVMFLRGGFLYVYFTYGAHFCCNVVTGPEGYGAAVLLRGIEPVEGIDKMIENRFNKKTASPKEMQNLTNGPGKICSAFEINREHNGADLTGSRIFILDAEPVPESEINISTRIGIKKAADYPWRFYTNSSFVSRR